MSREWEYSNLVSEAYECGGPDLYKEALYDAGKHDGIKAGLVVGTIGVLVALGVAAYEEGPKVVSWVKNRFSKKDGGVVAIMDEPGEDHLLAPDENTEESIPEDIWERKKSIFGIDEAPRMTNEERYKRCKLIIDAVSEEYGVKWQELFSKKRTAEIVLPRQVAMFLCREDADMSLEEICKTFGKNDCMTVMSAVNKVRSRSGYDKELARQIAYIRNAVSEDEKED